MLLRCILDRCVVAAVGKAGRVCVCIKQTSCFVVVAVELKWFSLAFGCSLTEQKITTPSYFILSVAGRERPNSFNVATALNNQRTTS
jgi:hypothetical protein